MSEDEKSSLMDAALAHVDPNRRKFLGILLAGVAAAPLLTSASLAAENKPAGQKGEAFPKNATSVKANTAIKDNRANTIKTNDQKTQTIKYSDKTGGTGNTPQIKSANTAIKTDNSRAIKGENQQIKGANQQIKGANPNTIKSESKPAPH
jgi:hypothetical protein